MDVSLRSIQTTVQQVAEAISAALRMEVEIADDRLLRVAGTGAFRAGVMRDMAQEGYIYTEVMRKRSPLLLTRPGHHPLCAACVHHRACPEKAELSCPILLDGGVCGVIGLVAMDDEQRRLLLGNSDALTEFLRKMADLLTTKLTERMATRERLLAASQLETVINYLDRGIMALDGQGRITHVNTRARQFLAGSSADLKGVPVREVLPEIGAGKLFEEARLHVSVPTGRQQRHLVCDVTPIRCGNRVEGAVITLQDEAEVDRLLSAYANQNLCTGPDSLLGVSPGIRRIKEIIQQIAQSDSTVLIRGESGTGKEICARAIHTASKRSGGPFIPVNCAAIPEPLLESELFGYERGAFTGARPEGKVGKFQLAKGGTLFLDEIGDLPLHLQAKLLRVLQERYIERLGGNRQIPVDVRVVAATNRDLEAMMRVGEFREDLFYRLNVIPLVMPPLRERPEDIPPLAEHFLRRYQEKLGRPAVRFSAAAMAALRRYSWPGNVRELANAVEYAVNMEQSDTVAVTSLPLQVQEEQPNDTALATPGVLNLKELERTALTRALAWVRSRKEPKEKAAALLGIGRATLFRKLKEYNLDLPQAISR